MPDPLTLMKNKETERRPLTTRQDEDKALIYNETFTMRNADGKKVPRVYSVTLPNAAIFYAKMVALIAGVNRQPTVTDLEDKMIDDDKAYIIDFLQDMDFEIDALLNNQGKRDAFLAHSGYFCGRGWSAELILMREEKGEFVADAHHLDPRWVTFETSRKGLEWAGHLMTRSKLDIEEEYDIKVSGQTGKVRDFYSRELHYVYVNDKLVILEGNPYGYVPFVIKAAPYGPILEEEDAIKHEGESIFYPHRDMFKEMNWMASIVKTQSFEDLRSALQQPGDKTVAAPDDYPTSDSILPVDNPLLLIPQRGLTNAMRNFQGIVTSILQRAGFSAIDEGTISFPIAAVLFARLIEQRGSLTGPRFQALGQLYRARTEMIISQVIEIGGTIEIGQEGMKRKYDTSKLKGSYTVSWKYPVSSLEDRATRQAIANAEVGMISRKTIRKDTLQLENPEAEENNIEIEEAKRMEPLITTLERIHSLIDEDTDQSNDEAWILFHKVETILKQRVTGGVAEPEAQPPLKPVQQIPVFAKGGGGTPPAEEVEAS